MSYLDFCMEGTMWGRISHVDGGIYVRASICMWKRTWSRAFPYIFGIIANKKNFIRNKLALTYPNDAELDIPKSSQVSGRQLHALSMSIFMGTCFEVCGSIPILFMRILGMGSPFLHICQQPRHPNWDKVYEYYWIIFLNRTLIFDWYVVKRGSKNKHQ